MNPGCFHCGPWHVPCPEVLSAKCNLITPLCLDTVSGALLAAQLHSRTSSKSKSRVNAMGGWFLIGGHGLRGVSQYLTQLIAHLVAAGKGSDVFMG